MIAENAKTTIGFPFSETSMRLTMALPCENDRMPHREGGYLKITDNKVANQSSPCGTVCGGGSAGCQSPRFEIVKYSGYESDGITAVIEDRGLDGTQRLNWCAGSIVTHAVGYEVNLLIEMLSNLCGVFPEREPDSKTFSQLFCDKDGLGKKLISVDCCSTIDQLFGVGDGVLTIGIEGMKSVEVRKV